MTTKPNPTKVSTLDVVGPCDAFGHLDPKGMLIKVHVYQPGNDVTKSPKLVDTLHIVRNRAQGLILRLVQITP